MKTANLNCFKHKLEGQLSKKSIQKHKSRLICISMYLYIHVDMYFINKFCFSKFSFECHVWKSFWFLFDFRFYQRT